MNNLSKQAVLIYLLIVVSTVFLGALPVNYKISSASAPTNGLVGYWKLDESSGLIASDSSGNNYTGTLKNNPTWVSGYIGNGLNFNGANHYVQVADNANINLAGTPYTISFWFQHNLSSSQAAGVMNKFGNGGYLLGISGGKFLVRHVATGANYTLSGNVTLSSGIWYHATIVYDRSTLKIYINGNLDKQMNATADLAANTSQLELGRFSSAYYKGLLDEVRIYNRALSPSEVLDIYNDTGGTPPPPDILPPSVPTGIFATPVSSSQINLAWNSSTDNVAVTGYQVFRQGAQVATTTATSYSDTGLSAGTSYDYAISAFDVAGNISAPSVPTVSASTFSQDTSGPIISNVATSNITQNSVTITWTTDELSDTQVNYGQTSVYNASSTLNSSLVTNHSTTLTGLVASSLYHYRARSADVTGNLAVSGDLTFTTLVPPDTTAPTVNITAPTPSSTVSSTVTVSATASDNVSVSGVQFLLDGANLGSEDTTIPYSMSWNSMQNNNGSHMLTARARDTALNQAMSASVPVTVNNSSSTSTPAAGLIGYWKLDESSGSTASDSSSGYSGNLINNPIWQTGNINNGLSLNGTNQYVSVPNTAALKLDGTAYSYSLWFRTNNPLKWQGLISKEGSSSYIATINANKVLVRHAAAGSFFDLPGTISLTASTWYHLAVVYDRTTLRIYINGNLDTSRNVSQDLSSNNNGPLIFGRFFGGNYLVGMLDEVRIYNQALTPSEVQDIYNGNFNPPPPPAPDTTAPIISATTTVSNIGISGATISWTTNEVSDSQIEFGPTTNYGTLTNLNSSPVTFHSVNLTGLSAGTTYHYRAKSRDVAGNLAISLDQRFTTAPVVGDTSAPLAVSDLTTSNMEINGVTLNWTAPFDLPFGNTSAYDIRYSTNPITLGNWDGANQVVTEPVPAPGNSSQKYMITGLSPATTYYFALRSKDAASNLSGLSNIVSAVTLSAIASPKVPIIDMGTGTYFGFEGGLYENTLNMVPSDHHAVGLTKASSVQPLDINGNPSSGGKIVLLSMGMSNTSWEFCSVSGSEPCGPETFMAKAATSTLVNHTNLLILNGAYGGQVALLWDSPLDSNYDRVRDIVLSPAGATEKQVQIIWVKITNSDPKISLPASSADMYVLENTLGNIVRAAKARYPNLKQIFFSSRVYAGYAVGALSPEPYVYENGFSIKRLIDAQIEQMRNNEIVVDDQAGDLNYTNDALPWIAWGPYMWADGMNPRSDGLISELSDFGADGVHPSINGSEKINNALMNFFLVSPYTPWFRQ